VVSVGFIIYYKVFSYWFGALQSVVIHSWLRIFCKSAEEIGERSIQRYLEEFIRWGGAVMTDAQHENTRKSRSADVTVMCFLTGFIIMSTTVYGHIEKVAAEALEMVGVRRNFQKLKEFVIEVSGGDLRSGWDAVCRVISDGCRSTHALVKTLGKVSASDLWHSIKNSVMHFNKDLRDVKEPIPPSVCKVAYKAQLINFTIAKMEKFVEDLNTKRCVPIDT
jgi:hypothetical protein